MFQRRFMFLATLIAVTALGIAGGNAWAQTKISKPGGGFPFKITKSGSYFLAETLAATGKTTTAIVVNASNVTINLNGFAITGVGLGKATKGVGIDASAATGVTIADGIITGYGGDGIALGNNSTVENMQVYNNGGDGVDCSASTACYVTSSVIAGNKLIGLDFGDASSGYLNNVLNLNGTDVAGGTNLGGNVCSGKPCP